MTTHIVVYEGRRVSLGLMQRDYGAAFVKFANLRGHIDGVSLRPPYYPKDFDTWFDRIEASKGKNEVFAILVHEEGADAGYRYVGHTGIHGITMPEAHGTTGTIIADPGAQGQGYGKEAKLLLQQHAFHTLHLATLRSAVKGFNAASLGHLIACGYRICGRYERAELYEGVRIPAILLECLPEDWLPRWRAYRDTGTLPTLTEEERALVRRETNATS